MSGFTPTAAAFNCCHIRIKATNKNSEKKTLSITRLYFKIWWITAIYSETYLQGRLRNLMMQEYLRARPYTESVRKGSFFL